MAYSTKMFGQKIKVYRKSQKMTQAELAEKVNVDSKYLSRIEMGVSSPSFKTIEKLAEVLNVSISQLFDFSHNKDRDIMISDLTAKINNYPVEKLELLCGFTNLIDGRNIK